MFLKYDFIDRYNKLLNVTRKYELIFIYLYTTISNNAGMFILAFMHCLRHDDGDDDDDDDDDDNDDDDDDDDGVCILTAILLAPSS